MSDTSFSLSREASGMFPLLHPPPPCFNHGYLGWWASIWTTGSGRFVWEQEGSERESGRHFLPWFRLSSPRQVAPILTTIFIFRPLQPPSYWQATAAPAVSLLLSLWKLFLLVLPVG